jgi:hypothetical protein
MEINLDATGRLSRYDITGDDKITIDDLKDILTDPEKKAELLAIIEIEIYYAEKAEQVSKAVDLKVAHYDISKTNEFLTLRRDQMNRIYEALGLISRDYADYTKGVKTKNFRPTIKEMIETLRSQPHRRDYIEEMIKRGVLLPKTH